MMILDEAITVYPVVGMAVNAKSHGNPTVTLKTTIVNIMVVLVKK